jgi:hypothetical protein
MKIMRIMKTTAWIGLMVFIVGTKATAAANDALYDQVFQYQIPPMYREHQDNPNARTDIRPEIRAFNKGILMTTMTAKYDSEAYYIIDDITLRGLQPVVIR